MKAFDSLERAVATLSDAGGNVYEVAKPDTAPLFVPAKTPTGALSVIAKSLGYEAKNAVPKPRRKPVRKSFEEATVAKVDAMSPEEAAKFLESLTALAKAKAKPAKGTRREP